MINEYDPSEEKLLDLTRAAKSHFSSCLEKKAGAIGIYLGVKKTGCSGLSYVTQVICEIPKDESIVINIDGITFYMQKNAMVYLKGLTLDYLKNSMGLSSLKYHNPNESARCGCGESFTISNNAEEEE